MNKLEACKSTRQIASQSLMKVLKQLLKSKNPISEVILRDAWLSELRKYTRLFPDGWYVPPPHGIIVLFATDKNLKRVNYKNVRPPEWHPRNDIFLDLHHGIAYVYVSPVDKRSGMIGDFGMTIYFGKDSEKIKHLQNCLKLTEELFKYTKIGMSLREITDFAFRIFQEKGLSNDIVSITDPSTVNIGHTVPASYENWNKEEKEILKKSDSNKIANLISKKRKFIGPKENLKIQPGMAITLEPRLTAIGKPNIPLSSFHTLVLFHKNGKKELLTNFKRIFKIAGMNYMYNN